MAEKEREGLSEVAGQASGCVEKPAGATGLRSPREIIEMLNARERLYFRLMGSHKTKEDVLRLEAQIEALEWVLERRGYL